MNAVLIERRARLRRALLRLLPVVLISLLLLAMPALAPGAHAQEPNTYTVQAGDTLNAIATRFGVDVNSIAAVNGISNPDLLYVGQQLLIPGPGAAGFTTLPADIVLALPGESLADVATRVGQAPAVLAELNGMAETQRLFPGRPVRVPLESSPVQPLRFGAVTQISTPNSIEQGRTGRLTIESARPVALEASWNGLALPLAPLDSPTRLTALLPVPALLGPGDFPLVITYTTTSGVPVVRNIPIPVASGGYDSQVISVPADRTDLLEAQRVAEELAKVTAAWSTFTPDLLLRAPFARPIGPEYATTSPFGTRRSYDSGANSTVGYHAGQDFGAPPGVPVLSPALGVVVIAEELVVRGNAVIVDHGRGIYTGYWHMSEITVSPGQVVQPG